jgi:hypothetical protein
MAVLNFANARGSVLIPIVLIVSFTLFAGYIQSPVIGVQSTQPTLDPFTVPVTISTYGNAWDGYLAFGLWDFPYGSTGFSLAPYSYLIAMTTKGQLLDLRTTTGAINISNFMATYTPLKYLGNNTLMFEGEPDTTTHFWNLRTNATTDFPNVYGHHDMIFNPLTRTFLTLTSSVRQIDGRNVLMDTVVELDSKGNRLWTWDTYDNGHFSLKDECPCNDTTVVNGKVVIDLTHANSLQWNFQTNIVYVNMRHLNTFCKINKITSQTIWCLGEHGNFTLLDPNGNHVPSLWYHSHDVKEVQPDVFLMFDNEYHNTTTPCPDTFEDTTAYSRIVEVTANEQNKTAWVSWSWEAPRGDWTPYWGEADRLPNGDWIGTFGSQSHYLPGTEISTPSPDSTGAVVVEVNSQGSVVRTYTFPYGWGIYRVVPISLQTIADYDGSLRTSDFNINLSSLNNIGGPTAIYYRVNGGPIKTVATDGQPHITTQGMNNTLEYWSVDSNGITESPHHMLTGIKLQRSPTTETSTSMSTSTPPPQVSSNNTILIVAAVMIVAVVTVILSAVRTRASRRGKKK